MARTKENYGLCGSPPISWRIGIPEARYREQSNRRNDDDDETLTSPSRRCPNYACHPSIDVSPERQVISVYSHSHLHLIGFGYSHLGVPPHLGGNSLSYRLLSLLIYEKNTYKSLSFFSEKSDIDMNNMVQALYKVDIIPPMNPELLIHNEKILKEEILRAVGGKKGEPTVLTEIIECLWKLWKEDLMAPAGKPRQGLSRTQLTKALRRTDPGNVNSYVTTARQSLQAVHLNTEGASFSFSVSMSPYMLIIEAETDPASSLKKFWSPYRDCTKEKPIFIGVLQRLFYLVKDEASGDEVYLRSRFVNLLRELPNSPLLNNLLESYPSHEHTRQYISSGDTAGAFTLLNLFKDIGIQAEGIRLPDNRTRDSSSIILGTAKSDKVILPGLPDFQYHTTPQGIADKGGELIFQDNWNAEETQIFVLLSRWPTNNSFCTVMHTNSAAAIEGVCLALADEQSVGQLLKIKRIGSEDQLIFKVGLIPGGNDSFNADSVSVLTKPDRFSLIWPSLDSNPPPP